MAYNDDGIPTLVVSCLSATSRMQRFAAAGVLSLVSSWATGQGLFPAWSYDFVSGCISFSILRVMGAGSHAEAGVHPPPSLVRSPR
jgi:hypothetical protein